MFDRYAFPNRADKAPLERAEELQEQHRAKANELRRTGMIAGGIMSGPDSNPYAAMFHDSHYQAVQMQVEAETKLADHYAELRRQIGRAIGAEQQRRIQEHEDREAATRAAAENEPGQPCDLKGHGKEENQDIHYGKARHLIEARHPCVARAHGTTFQVCTPYADYVRSLQHAQPCPDCGERVKPEDYMAYLRPLTDEEIQS